MRHHSQETAPSLYVQAAKDAFRKLDPRVLVRNPVMFVVAVGCVFTTASFFSRVVTGADAGFSGQISLWLWFTVLFANFAEALAEGLVELMARKDITARIMARRSSYMVYLKSGNAITEFLAFTGAHQAALSMEEERVVKSVRNDVNRQINAELANQQKAASAAVEQIYAIRRVVEHYGMEDLPPAIREFIRLRVTYPEASLKELGQRATPPLSKSAVYHRVRRLESMAAELDAGE